MQHASRLLKLGMAVLVATAAATALAQADKPIKIGVSTAMALQVGRDSIDCGNLAIEEINAKGGVLGRKLQLVPADETENPEQGIAAVKKLTSDEKVDVIVGGYTTGVTLAQLPHISAAKTIYVGVGAASPAITAKVKQDYPNYKYVFRISPVNSVRLAQSVVGYVTEYVKGDLGIDTVAMIGESAKWVQDLIPVLKKGVEQGGVKVAMSEVFDTATTDFSPILSKVKASGAKYLVVILSHASSDVFAKQWYDARFPIPYGGIDVKSQDANFYERVGGKSISEVNYLSIMRAPLSPKTIPFIDKFQKRFNRIPVYTGTGTYDGIYAYAEAVQRAGSLDTDKVIKELEKTDMQATTGRVVFDETHDVRDGPGYVAPLFVQWQDKGERAILWPKQIATGKFVYQPWITPSAKK